MGYSTSPRAFTIIELVVVISLLSILSTIGFVSLSGYQNVARDSVRISDIKSIHRVIELHRLQEGGFPSIENSFNVTFQDSVIWSQGSFGQSSIVDSRQLSEIPTDPLTGNEYTYSVTAGSSEYQIGAMLEGSTPFSYIPSTYAETPVYNFHHSYITGNYNGKFMSHTDTNEEKIYVLGIPALITNHNSSDISISEILNKNKYVYNNKKSVPGSYSGSIDPTDTWNFVPNSPSEVIYSIDKDVLSTQEGKIEFISQLRNYYKDTEIFQENNFKELRLSEVGNDSDIISLMNTYIQGNIGAMGNIEQTSNIESICDIDLSDLEFNNIYSTSSYKTIDETTIQFSSANTGWYNSAFYSKNLKRPLSLEFTADGNSWQYLMIGLLPEGKNESEKNWNDQSNKLFFVYNYTYGYAATSTNGNPRAWSPNSLRTQYNSSDKWKITVDKNNLMTFYKNDLELHSVAHDATNEFKIVVNSYNGTDTIKNVKVSHCL